MYNGAALLALAGGLTLGGLAFAANGGKGGALVGLVGAAVTLLLGYRAWRVKRATRAETR